MKKTIIILSIFFLLCSFSFVENTHKGEVLYYIENKGFGYIKGIDKEVYYVYESGLIAEIKKDNYVSFKVRDTRKGLEAYDVKFLKKQITWKKIKTNQRKL